MSICQDAEDQERDDALFKIQQLSHFDDRTVQYVEVGLMLMHACHACVALTAKVISTGPLNASI